MFDGIKLLCLIKEKEFLNDCLHSVIIPADKYMKAANKPFQCPECGRKSKSLMPYFRQLLNLNALTKSLPEKGFYVRCYDLAFESSHEDGFEATPHILENNDWGTWNMQISCTQIACTESPGCREYIWEDHFFKAKPFVYPFWRMNGLTFSQVLRRKKLFVIDHEITNIDLLKKLLKLIRSYNNSWMELLDSGFNAAPVDLEHGLYIHLAGVDSLDELYPDEAYD